MLEGEQKLTSPCATSSVQLSVETHAQGALRWSAHSGGESGAGMEVVWVWVEGVPWSSGRSTGARTEQHCPGTRCEAHAPSAGRRGRRIFSAQLPPAQFQ